MLRCACAEMLLSRGSEETEVAVAAPEADTTPPGAPGAPELSACSVKIIFSTEIEMYYPCNFAARVAFKMKYQQLIVLIIASFEEHTSFCCTRDVILTTRGHFYHHEKFILLYVHQKWQR